METRIIITCLLLSLPLHCYEDETLADTSFCTPYCATPCHQQPQQTMEIITIITCLLLTLPLYCSEDETLAEKSYFTPHCATPCHQQQKTNHGNKNHHYLFTFQCDFTLF